MTLHLETILAVAVLLSVVVAVGFESDDSTGQQTARTLNCDDCGAPNDSGGERCDHRGSAFV